MSVFKRKKTKGQSNVLTDNYVPATLPSFGQGLESFVACEYSMNQQDIIEKLYKKSKQNFSDVIAACDYHSTGSECDSDIDVEIQHMKATHKAEIADHENQLTRICSARQMRKESLERMLSSLKKECERLESEIKPLEGLRTQFNLHLGRRTISIGTIITVIAMIVDACVNYSFLQTILLSNSYLLMITVICMSVMSDVSMWGLGTFLSRKDEKFTSKPLYYLTCVGLVSMFLLSVAASVMVRWGSMDATYGTINAAGEFVGKDSYSIAEYGVTLITAFITTSTGILSFAFSLDKNSFLVTIREKKKKELAICNAKLDLASNELALLEKAPDPRERDEHKRTAAESQIEAIRIGLKLQIRRQMAIRVNDSNFTEQMALSGKALLKNDSDTEALINAIETDDMQINDSETNDIQHDDVQLDNTQPNISDSHTLHLDWNKAS